MNRDDFLDDDDVKRFLEWAGNLVRGEWGLSHQWRTQERYGGNFTCGSLYEAYRGYSWHHLKIDETMLLFAGLRKKFENFGAIETSGDKDEFLKIAHLIAVDWGGSNRLDLWSSSHWGDMLPAKLQEHIDEIRLKLDPAKADTEDLPVSLRMGAGFRKIYSMIVPELPIYDSRVACALSCLVGIYQQNKEASGTGDVLSFPVPAWRRTKGSGPDRCAGHSIGYVQYANANLKCAWLLQGLLEHPGEFANVPEPSRVDALQSALFMLGYSRLRDNAMVKTR